MPGNTTKDSFGRSVSYLRLSVTDRCNLSCFYCRTKNAPFVPHERILTYEEMLRMVDLARELNISKVRLTGGEPFARRGFMGFVGALCSAYPDLDVRVTTNGTLIRGRAGELRRLGLRAVNISLDTLRRDVFSRITGQDGLDDVLAVVGECLEAGIKVKVNVVAMRGVNEEDLPGFLDMARTMPLDVRFIEFMPIGQDTNWQKGYLWAADDILARARELAGVEPVPAHEQSGGPARIFRVPGGLGRLGIISPLSNHFCNSCNRLRITAEGKVRTCLFSDREYRLRPVLRHPRLGPEAALRIMRLALARKPLGYELLNERRRAAVCGKGMSSIGG